MLIIVLGVIIAGVILLQAYTYRKFWDRALSLDFRFSDKEAFEGDALFLNAEISNRKMLPLPWLLLEYQLSANLVFPEGSELEVGDLDKSGLYSVMMYKRVRRKMRFVCGKRGFYRLRRIRLTCSNLLHTQSFNKDIECTAELTVFPRLLENLDEFAMMVNSLDAMMLVHSLINPDPFTFRGIREYQPTDPLRSVNFKATAVAQQLMVNIHAPTSSKRLEIILNLEHYMSLPNYDLFEQAIRLAATFAHHYISEDVMVGFYTNGRDAFTGENVCIPSGTASPQLYAIYKALGKLALAFKPSHISAYMDTLEDTGSVYVIISTYHGDDFVTALERMEERGLSVMTVLPVEKSMTIGLGGSSKIKVWEALG